jgi:tryptophan synthase beta chain
MKSYFGDYGGQFVNEMLLPVLKEVEEAFERFCADSTQQAELADLLKNFAGRETPLTHAHNLSKELGFQLYLKREDLLHGGAHKTNNALGQAMLAKFMGKKEIIAETGAGQHGVATALAGAMMGLPVKIFMGAVDIERQQPNVLRMKLFGAELIPVEAGSKTLKDAINEALRYYVAHNQDVYYLFGTAAGPHPFPRLVSHFQSVIGKEARAQILDRTGKLPNKIVACVGGGSNAIGIFSAFLKDENVELIGVEPALGAPLQNGSPGIVHGAFSYLMQDEHGQVTESHSCAAGLDYPGVGPEHSFLKDQGRATYLSITDEEALSALQILCKKEGILPALESSHALAQALKFKGQLNCEDIVIVNLSGRGDKDLAQVNELLTHLQ